MIDLVIELRKTTSLRIPDAIIASTAMLAGAELVTRDLGFRQVPGLKLIPIEILDGP
jgi:predicted nucleic acid-binding protein